MGIKIMKLLNPIRISQWSIKPLIILILFLQITLGSLISLDYLGFHIPLLREIIGFFYLIFIPGILIIRLMELENLNNTDELLYSVGVSIAILMFIGLFMNTFYPLFGFTSPLSTISLFITINVLVWVLCALNFIKVRNKVEPIFLRFEDLISPSTLFLCLIPFLAIIGTYLVNSYNNNLLILLSLVLVAIIPLLVTFDKLPKRLYPLSIFVISITLLFHISLISFFIYGRDSFEEYFVASITLKNMYWNPNTSDYLNSVFTVSIFPTILAKICNLNLEWIFKIIYQFLYVLVPLTLYQIFKEQTNEKISFFSVFFFVASITFFFELPQLFRQEIGEIFFVLSVLLILTTKISPVKKSILLVTFLITLTFSHYALSFIYAFLLFCIWAVAFLINSSLINKIKNKFKLLKDRFQFQSPISFNFVLLAVVVALSWYIFVSNSEVFKQLIVIAKVISRSLVTELLNPKSSEALDIAFQPKKYITLSIITFLNLAAQGFIAIGLLTTFWKDKFKINPSFYLLALINFVFWIFAVTIPYFSSILTADRLYHITLIFLSLFLTIGLYKILNLVFSLNLKNSLKIGSVFLVVFFVLNVGFVGFFIGEETSMALDSSADWPKANVYELQSAIWINSEKNMDYVVYADVYRWPLVGAFNWNGSNYLPQNLTWIPQSQSYIYLGSQNIKNNQFLYGGGKLSGGNYIPINEVIADKDLIFDNGGSRVYY